MLWIILIGLFLAFLLWLLFSPIYLTVEWNDARQLAQLHWWGVLKVGLLPEQDTWIFRLELPFYTTSRPLSKWWPKGERESERKAEKKRKKSWRPKHPRQLVRRLWRSFHLIRFKCDIDTDDYIWNAYLFPLFRLTNPATHKDWRINFKGRNEWLLIVENRLYRLLYAFLRTAV